MSRERERKSYRDADRGRTSSYRSAETLERYESAGRQNAAAKEYKAALEALFQKKPDAAETLEKLVPSVKVARVVEPASEAASTQGNKRQELLRKLGAAQGSKAISDLTDALFNAGFTMPDDQELWLQVLEHRDESRVRDAIERLGHLLAGQLPKRKPVLVQRLKRLEENADESATREAAGTLRRRVG